MNQLKSDPKNNPNEPKKPLDDQFVTNEELDDDEDDDEFDEEYDDEFKE